MGLPLAEGEAGTLAGAFIFHVSFQLVIYAQHHIRRVKIEEHIGGVFAQIIAFGSAVEYHGCCRVWKTFELTVVELDMSKHCRFALLNALVIRAGEETKDVMFTTGR